jgi:GGDEF domain-containing protein
VYPHDGADIGSLIKNADAAMYHAKVVAGSSSPSGSGCYARPAPRTAAGRLKAFRPSRSR